MGLPLVRITSSAQSKIIPIANGIFNSQALGWVKRGQGERNIRCGFASFGQANTFQTIGCEGIRVEEQNELARVLLEASTNGKPALVDMHSSPDEKFRKVTPQLDGER